MANVPSGVVELIETFDRNINPGRATKVSRVRGSTDISL